jgi:hypothetical protein
MSTIDISSLLFYAIAESSPAQEHMALLKQALARGQYMHGVPALTQYDFEDGDIKWTFDFTDSLAGGSYHDALSKFIETHEQFILDVLAVDPAIKYELSAQLSVDASIGAFQIDIPRIPPRIAVNPSFRFGYFVWHVASDASDGENTTLQ